MSYVVFARRFRPQVFDDIIGQEHISKTLKNAIKENRVAHAYLFSGPRGVGKTTTARILAKALNCKNGPTETPCGVCPNCKEIVSGASVDVQEIDGASNRGIDEIRTLRDNVKFAPANSKYKIYIIDEAHQITDAAFNALLKTLEEPPSHVVFILATTESQKIPITILSRCQKYRFRLLSSSEIMSSLKKIVETDKFKVEEDALKLVTESAGGSLRDALSLMDQVVSFCGDKITANDVINLLGFMPAELIKRTVLSIHTRNQQDIMELIKEITESGYSLVQFARDLMSHFRKLMLYKINPGILETAETEKQVFESQKDMFTTDWLLRSARLLGRLLDEMRYTDQPRLILEIYMLKLSQEYVSMDQLVSRLEKLENNMPFENSEINVPEAAPKVKEQAEDLTPVSENSQESSQDLNKNWFEIVYALQKQKPMLGNILKECALKGISSNTVTIAVSGKFQEDSIKRNQQLIEDALLQKFGRPFAMKTVIEKIEKRADNDNMIVVENENNTVETGEVFEVETQSDSSKEEIPQDILKITSKIPGKVVKRK